MRKHRTQEEVHEPRAIGGDAPILPPKLALQYMSFPMPLGSFCVNQLFAIYSITCDNGIKAIAHVTINL